MDTLNFTSRPDGGQIRLMEAIARKVFHLPRIVASFVMIAGAAAATAFFLDSGEMVAPLFLLCLTITALYGLLLFYALRRRTALLRAIRQSGDRPAGLSFSEDGFFVSRQDAEARFLSYADVCAQYWCGDNYLLHVDNEDCREMFCIPVSGESFDGLYELASLLQKKKKPLTRLNIAITKGV